MDRSSFTRMVLTLLLLSVLPCVWGDSSIQNGELIQKMLKLAFDNSETLRSTERVVGKSAALPELKAGFSISGGNIGISAAVWNPDTNTFGFVPSFSIGLGFSFLDSAKIRESLLLKKEKEGVLQDSQRVKEAITSNLLTSIREILRLQNKKEGLESLLNYLMEQTDLMEKQVSAGLIKPDMLWDFNERIISTENQVKEAETQLSSAKLETAIKFGGDEWQALLELLGQLK